jgi:hypothetical protein
MILWTFCMILGLITVAFAPLLISATVRALAKFGRQYPLLADVIATIIVIVVGAFLLVMSGVFAAVYHHIFIGTP